jgi:cytochrome P450/NADPH-cytochrome P450 reductase
MQEVLLLVAMVRSIFLSYNHADVQIFQSFDIRPHNPDYKLQIKHTITLKPRDFYMHASPRKGRDISTIIGIGAEEASSKEVNGKEYTNGSTGKVDLSVFYG